jgi:peptide/nickel transport system substrate-binding protein
MEAMEDSSGPVRGGQLIMGVTGKMSSLDPVKGNAFLWEGNVILGIYNRLYRYGPEGDIVPELATSWEVSPDKLHITFKLRQGVMFHDGTPFNAQAAKFNLDRLMVPEDATQVYTWFKAMESVDVLDDYTVRINMSEPSAMIMTVLTSKAGFMVSPAAMKKYGEQYNMHPTGTGPFKLSEWVPGDHLLLSRNENYWEMGEDGKPLPYLDELLVRVITDASVRLVELQTGNIHLMQAVPAESLDIVRNDKQLDVVRTPSSQIFRVYCNFQKSPTDNVLVRRAINYALDRKAMAKALVPGQDFLPPFYYLPDSPEYYDYTPYSYDPDKAKELLTEAGYPNGIDLSLMLISREPDRTMAPVVQSYLNAVGIRTKIEELERLVAIDRANAGEFQLYQAKAGLPQPATQILLENMWTTGGPWNRQWYSNPKFDALVDELRVTFDQQRRIELFHKAQEMLLDDGEIVLFGMSVFQANIKKLHGFTFEAEGALRFTEGWLTK